jgi:putative nucleotidyltransferase with HDIG domain
VSSVSRFLNGTAQALATMALYESGHPARDKAVDRAFQSLSELQDETLHVHLTFLGGEVLLGDQPVRELRDWSWGPRLAAGGIQRLEFTERVTRDDFEVFLDEAFVRLTGARTGTADVRQFRPSKIRYGGVGLKGEGEDSEEFEDLATATLSYSLREEIQGVAWLHDELKGGKGLQLLEAEALVRSLSVAMHGDRDFFLPLVRLKRYDQYTVTHALNVSVLSMALAEFLGLTPAEVRAFGMAGLLHDLGKVKIPVDILNKPGRLTDQEREVINGHPAHGARIILETEVNLDLAAVVAYEHHIHIDGGGYPPLRFKRGCHQASNLVHVCDVFDALRTHRPYREAWSTERALGLIQGGAAKEFDPDLAHAFLQMMHRWERRVMELSIEEPELPGHTTASVPAASSPAEPPSSPAPDEARPGQGGS